MDHSSYCSHLENAAILGCRVERFSRIKVLNRRKDENERRASDRFPIERDVRYRIMNRKTGDEVGAGKTVNMSSTGVLFTTEGQLTPGRLLELAISWPAQLNDKVPLKLVARVRLVRSEDGSAAVEIQQYEFRTAGIANGAAAPSL
jgi:PilZ domain